MERFRFAPLAYALTATLAFLTTPATAQPIRRGQVNAPDLVASCLWGLLPSDIRADQRHEYLQRPSVIYVGFPRSMDKAWFDRSAAACGIKNLEAAALSLLTDYGSREGAAQQLEAFYGVSPATLVAAWTSLSSADRTAIEDGMESRGGAPYGTPAGQAALARLGDILKLDNAGRGTLRNWAMSLSALRHEEHDLVPA